jgi:hypothetical protein
MKLKTNIPHMCNLSFFSIAIEYFFGTLIFTLQNLGVPTNTTVGHCHREKLWHCSFRVSNGIPFFYSVFLFSANVGLVSYCCTGYLYVETLLNVLCSTHKGETSVSYCRRNAEFTKVYEIFFLVLPINMLGILGC